MAPRIVQISTSALICSFVLLPLLAVWGQADGPTGLGPADWSALRFTILQAALSALLSTLSAQAKSIAFDFLKYYTKICI